MERQKLPLKLELLAMNKQLSQHFLQRLDNFPQQQTIDFGQEAPCDYTSIDEAIQAAIQANNWMPNIQRRIVMKRADKTTSVDLPVQKFIKLKGSSTENLFETRISELADSIKTKLVTCDENAIQFVDLEKTKQIICRVEDNIVKNSEVVFNLKDGDCDSYNKYRMVAVTDGFDVLVRRADSSKFPHWDRWSSIHTTPVEVLWPNLYLKNLEWMILEKLQVPATDKKVVQSMMDINILRANNAIKDAVMNEQENITVARKPILNLEMPPVPTIPNIGMPPLPTFIPKRRRLEPAYQKASTPTPVGSPNSRSDRDIEWIGTTWHQFSQTSKVCALCQPKRKISPLVGNSGPIDECKSKVKKVKSEHAATQTESAVKKIKAMEKCTQYHHISVIETTTIETQTGSLDIENASTRKPQGEGCCMM